MVAVVPMAFLRFALAGTLALVSNTHLASGRSFDEVAAQAATSAA